MWGRSKEPGSGTTSKSTAGAGVQQQQQQVVGDSTPSSSGAKAAEWAIRPLSLFGLAPGSRREDDEEHRSSSAAEQTGNTPTLKHEGNQGRRPGRVGAAASPAATDKKLTTLGKLAADPVAALTTPGRSASKAEAAAAAAQAGSSESSPPFSAPVACSSASSGDATMIRAVAESAGSTPGKEETRVQMEGAGSSARATPLSAPDLGAAWSSSPLSAVGGGGEVRGGGGGGGAVLKGDESAFLTARVVNGKISMDEGGRANHVFVLHCTFGRIEWWENPPLIPPSLPAPRRVLHASAPRSKAAASAK